MKVTNKFNLPLAFVKAVSVERHNKKGCYSATTLNKGTKEIILQERHWDEFQTDASDNVWATFGTAVHAIMEKLEDENFHEEKFDIKVSNSRITGIVDSYDMANGVINDWKTASVFKVMNSDFADWKKQGLTYAWLLKKNGLDVRKCRFIAMLKDHSKSKASIDRSYPQSPVFVYEFPVSEKDFSDTEKRIFDKVHEIEQSELLPDDEIVPCSADERWASEEKFAVMKDGRKTAVRVLSTLEDAEKLACALGKGHRVERREATSKKCEGYCLCKDFCSFYKSNVKKYEE